MSLADKVLWESQPQEFHKAFELGQKAGREQRAGHPEKARKEIKAFDAYKEAAKVSKKNLQQAFNSGYSGDTTPPTFHEGQEMKQNEDSGAVAKEILSQLGGNKFIAMTGAKQLGHGDDEKGNSYLGFRIGKNASQTNYVRVTLLPSDTYRMDFMRVSTSGNKTLKTFDDVYFDKLQELFTEVTGMYTSLGTMGRKAESLAEQSLQAYGASASDLDESKQIYKLAGDKEVSEAGGNWKDGIKIGNHLTKDQAYEIAQEVNHKWDNLQFFARPEIEDGKDFQNARSGEKEIYSILVRYTNTEDDFELAKKQNTIRKEVVKFIGDQVKKVHGKDWQSNEGFINEVTNKAKHVADANMMIKRTGEQIRNAQDKLKAATEKKDKEGIAFWTERISTYKEHIKNDQEHLRIINSFTDHDKEDRIEAAKKQKKHESLADQVVGEAKMQLSLIKFPSGKYGFAGNVPPELAYIKKGNKAVSDAEFKELKDAQMPSLVKKKYGIETLSFDSTEAALTYAKHKANIKAEDIDVVDESLNDHPTTAQIKGLKKPKKTILDKEHTIRLFKVEDETLDKPLYMVVDLDNESEHAAQYTFAEKEAVQMFNKEVKSLLDSEKHESLASKVLEAHSMSEDNVDDFLDGKPVPKQKYITDDYKFFSPSGMVSVYKDARLLAEEVDKLKDIFDFKNGMYYITNRNQSQQYVDWSKTLTKHSKGQVFSYSMSEPDAKKKSVDEIIYLASKNESLASKVLSESIGDYTPEEWEQHEKDMVRYREQGLLKGVAQRPIEEAKPNWAPEHAIWFQRADDGDTTAYVSKVNDAYTYEIFDKHGKTLKKEHGEKSLADAKKAVFVYFENSSSESATNGCTFDYNKKEESLATKVLEGQTDSDKNWIKYKSGSKEAVSNLKDKIGKKGFMCKLGGGSSPEVKVVYIQSKDKEALQKKLETSESMASQALQAHGIVESGSYAGKEELLPEGEDIEVGDIQYHRFRDSLQATDISNAGKKGKTGKQVSIWAHRNKDQTPIEAYIADSLMKLKNIDDVEQAFKDLASTHKEDGWDVQTTIKKGVDIHRELGNKVEVNNGSLGLDASPKSISWEDLKDHNNQMRGYITDDKKTILKKAWELIQDNKEKIEKMSYQEFKNFLSEKGIQYKTYAGMD